MPEKWARYDQTYTVVHCACGHDYPFILRSRRDLREHAIHYHQMNSCPVCLNFPEPEREQQLAHLMAEAEPTPSKAQRKAA